MAADISFHREDSFKYGVVQSLAADIRRVVAPNPSNFTLYGTGTYIVGRGRVALIDPGPAIEAHTAALLAALEGEEITHLIVTHTHRDHSPACAVLKAECGAGTYGYGPHGAGTVHTVPRVEEGADWDFVPDHELRHGDVLEGDGWSLECVHTPGHTSNHLCYQLRARKALFSGDHVMGWSTSVISPPDGDMGAYMRSLRLLLDRDDVVYWPAHGPRISDPKPHVRAFIEHRLRRERQIIACVAAGAGSIEQMVGKIYRNLPEAMHAAAARQLLASVLLLIEQRRVCCDGDPARKGAYRLFRGHSVRGHT